MNDRVTVDFALSAGYSLTVGCTACRISKPVDLLTLSIAGRGKQRVSDIKFTCSTPECGARGIPTLTPR